MKLSILNILLAVFFLFTITSAYAEEGSTANWNYRDVFSVCIILILVFLVAYLKTKANNLATKEDVGDITKIVEQVKSDFEYVKEKEKNLATKEDVGDITRKVEEVKVEFSKDVAKLQSELQLLTHIKQSLISEARTALVDLHEQFSKWISLVSNSNFNGVDSFKGEELDLYFDKIDTASTQCIIAEAKMKLFVENIELSNLSSELRQLIIEKTHLSIIETIRNLKVTAINLNEAKRNLDKKMSEELIKQNGAIRIIHMNKVREDLKPVLSKHNEFISKTREYLNKLISQ